MAATIYSGIVMTDGAADCTPDEVAHDALVAAEKILKQVDEKYPDKELFTKPVIKPIDEVFDADLKMVFGGSSDKTENKKTVTHDEFNTIADLRSFLTYHPDSNMITRSCLWYLGEDAQKWWDERTGGMDDINAPAEFLVDIPCSVCGEIIIKKGSVIDIPDSGKRYWCSKRHDTWILPSRKNQKNMSVQEAVEYSRKNNGAKVMREGGNVPMIVGEDGFVYDDNGDYYAFDIDDLLAKNWRPC